MPESITFGPEAGPTVVINSSLQLPGSHIGSRIMQLDLGLDPQTDFLGITRQPAPSYAELAGVSESGQVEMGKAQSFLRSRLLAIGYGRDQANEAVSLLPRYLGRGSIAMSRPQGEVPETPMRGSRDDMWAVDPVLGNPAVLIQEFADHASHGEVAIPGKNSAGKGVTTVTPYHQEPEPRLFLIERYTISFVLGDYGMGRTVRTFTLLPGESTTIRLKTWQSTTESIKQSSSIIDSHEQSARDRFSSKVQSETTDKKTRAQTESWQVQAEASGSWGFGSASVSAGASGEYQSGREQFARQTSEALGEHAKEASSKRELTVTSSAETKTETGMESLIEREINNVNMRRVLNFVFRELNQQYTTRLHLTDIHVGYTNGLDGTWREVPVAGLRTLLSEVLVPGKIDDTATSILKVASVVFDAQDVPVRVLEAVDYDSANDTIAVSAIQPGPIPPPTETRYYRFQRGPLNQDDAEHPVDGVLLSEQTIVMRTDSVIVEALLGQSDALDSFAMEIQEAAARAKTLHNERETLLLDTLRAIPDPEARATMAATLFNPPDAS
ncbi:hypothetical protein [Lysobacter sp. A421]